eukprot:Phypoly_transcript_00825.p1 GENE.Phypoly_transcript_00825~~Phypoly_transcript_00825.p1  ORF type:complete len:1137 (+),score=176.51 Phypoly_transcript_00825:525-3935(+)
MQGNQVFIKICVTRSGNSLGLQYDEYSHAAKVAGHDLKGLEAVLSCMQANNGLHVPLTCIVDYKGYRALVMTAVPISAKTQINSSSYLNEELENFLTMQGKDLQEAKNKLEAAEEPQEKEKKERVVKAINEKIESERARRTQMVKDVDSVSKQIAAVLGLRKHSINDLGQIKKDIFFPKDLEIHEGYDGRLYALDFARLMPPEMPEGHAGRLFRLFRPEFMRARGFPLSSDAYDPHNITEKDFPAENQATRYLQNELIPHAVSSFSDSDQKDAATLKKYMHKHGINLRYLGLFLYHLRTKRPAIQGKVIQSEMVARAYTHVINGIMRKIESENFCKKLCIDKFRNILNYNSRNYLLKDLQEQLQKMYLPHLLDKTATASLFDNSNAEYWHNIIRNNSTAIVRRVSEMTGAKWDSEVLEQIEREGGNINQAQDVARLTFVPVEKTIAIQPTPEVHRANGDYMKAVQCYKAEVRIRKQILGPDHLRVAIALIYLSEAYLELNNSYGRTFAERYLLQAIAIYEKARRIKHVEMEYAIALERMAKFLLRYQERQTDKVDALLKDALAIKKELNDKTEIVKTMNLQAWADYRRGNYAGAKSKYLECIKTYKDYVSLTCSHASSLAITNSNLSLTMKKLGKFKEATALANHAMAVMKDLHNKTKSKVYKAHLATIEDNFGKIMESEALQQDKDKEKSLNATDIGQPAPKVAPQPRVAASSIHAPSPVVEQTGTTDFIGQARSKFESAYKCRREVFGGKHYLTAFSMDHVAQAETLADKLATILEVAIPLKTNKNANIRLSHTMQAFDRYKAALPILRTSLGPYHSSVGILLHNIAILLASQNNYSRAREAQKEALYILHRSYGQNHKQVIEAKKALDSYDDVHEKLPDPMKHDGMLPPDMRDPACFWAPYLDKNPNLTDTNKDFQTFVKLLSEAEAELEDVNTGLTEDLYESCQIIIQAKNLEEEKLAELPKNFFGRLEVSCGSLSNISISLCGRAPFELQDSDSIKNRFKPLPKPRMVDSNPQGRDPGPRQALPESITRIPTQKDPAPVTSTLSTLSIHGGPSASPKDAELAPTEKAKEEEKPYLENTPMTVEEAEEILNPLLRLLAESEWNEIINITRELVYENRLLASAERLPFANELE